MGTGKPGQTQVMKATLSATGPSQFVRHAARVPSAPEFTKHSHH